MNAGPLQITFDVDTILTLMVVAFAIDRVYRYSVKKLETIQRPLMERRSDS